MQPVLPFGLQRNSGQLGHSPYGRIFIWKPDSFEWERTAAGALISKCVRTLAWAWNGICRRRTLCLRHPRSRPGQSHENAAEDPSQWSANLCDCPGNDPFLYSIQKYCYWFNSIHRMDPINNFRRNGYEHRHLHRISQVSSDG